MRIKGDFLIFVNRFYEMMIGIFLAKTAFILSFEQFFEGLDIRDSKF